MAPPASSAGDGADTQKGKIEASHLPLQLGLDLGGLSNSELEAILSNLSPRGKEKQETKKAAAPVLDALSTHKKALQAKPAKDVLQRPSGQHSLLHGPALGGGRCGERLQFTITVVSDDGKICKSTDGVRVTAIITGLDLMSKTHPEPKPWIVDTHDGTYMVQFVCATPGKYDLTAYVDGVALPMCPCKIDILPGLPSPMHSEIRGVGTQTCEVGSKADFIIQARDEFGNPCRGGGSRFGVRASGHARLHEVVDNEDGTYNVCYSVPEWAQGTVQLDILLDGVPLKDSPLTPITHAKALPADASVGQGQQVTGAASLQEQLEALRWLKENKPGEVPEVPGKPLPGMWPHLEDASSPSGGKAPARGRPEGADGVELMAWRTADEWRRIQEARQEMARCREQLAEHQKVLLGVGDAVHNEFMMLKDRKRGVQAKSDELGEVESRLDALRADIGRQYSQQQRVISNAGYSGAIADGSGEQPSMSSWGSPISRGPGQGPARRPIRGAAPSAPGSPGSPYDSLPDAVATRAARLEERGEMEQLAALLEETERKQRDLRKLEEADDAQSKYYGYGVMRDGPDQAGKQAARDQNRGRIMTNPLPPPAPPPRLAGEEGLGVGGMSPQSRGLLAAPPPPPNPPPAGQTGFGGVTSPARSALAQPLLPPASPPSAGFSGSPGSPATNIQSEDVRELNRATKNLFNAYAKSTTASRGPAASRRKALGFQDFLNLAQAAQLRVPPKDLEAAFLAKAARGNSRGADQVEPTLTFELFVELLVLTAELRYPGVGEQEATTTLYSEHLMPLSSRIREQEASRLDA